MYKILNELTGIESQLPVAVDAPDEEGESQDIEIFRIPDKEDHDEGSCGCGDNQEDPVEDLVNRFRDWLTQNIDLELGHDDEVGPEDEIVNDIDPDESVENEEPISNDDVEDPQTDIETNQDGDLGSGPDELEHPNRQGMIRTIKGAHLVYKRKTSDGFYEELWMFNIGKDSQRDEMEIRKDILSGTDIPPESMKSKDGTQSYELWTSGNGQMLKIVGLPN